MVPAVVLTVLLLQLLYVAGRMAIVPVLAAFALAYLLDPFVERLERRGLSRTVASLAAMLLVGLTGARVSGRGLTGHVERGLEVALPEPQVGPCEQRWDDEVNAPRRRGWPPDGPGRLRACRREQ
jgi:hypothetical protein